MILRHHALNFFLGCVTPVSGQVRVSGIDPVTQPDQARRDLACIPENVAMSEHLTARKVPALLLDEPTSGQDPHDTAEFNRLLGVLREQGVAILMVTHDLLSAADVADRIGCSAGQSSALAALAAQPKHDTFDRIAWKPCRTKQAAAA